MRKGRGKFAESAKAKAFLHDIFGRVDHNYAKYGDLLWEIYRNGPIHLYEPMRLRNQGRRVGWSIYKRPRAHALSRKIAGREYSFSATRFHAVSPRTSGFSPFP